MKKRFFSRILAMMLCLSVVFSAVFALFPVRTTQADISQDSVTSTETTYLDGVHYSIEKNISYIGNRSYQLNVELKTSLTENELVLSREYAKNGYFTVEITGWYLLELWGGKGADGGESLDILIGRPGGKGGSRGYVYAKVYLEQGQTLAYSIGTNGKQTQIQNSGGGVNGSGGGHGAGGSQIVGGGGGYSALYFFNAGEFDTSWLNASGTWNMPSSVRLNRYVMIAAGGGGGGAGNGSFWANATDSNGQKLANGGSGGNITNGVSMQMQAANGTVGGYLFFGKNGQSSGKSTAYIGKGGTNRPGANPTSEQSEKGPNDWSGAFNLDSTPGAGGIGLYRGGGGGAGFCGGSGGSMTGQATASNVGGGGGGSSFLATAIGTSETQFGTSVDQDKLHGTSGCPSTSGGAFSYTFLGNEEGVEVNTTYLRNVSVAGGFSQYFDVFANPSSDGTMSDAGVANKNGELTYDEESGKFTVTGANIDASSVDRTGKLLSLSFLLKAKKGFLGGNNVPLLTDLSITMDRGTSELTVISASEQASTDYVNVPLYLPVATHSKMISRREDEDPPTFKIAELYTNEHSAAISNIAEAGWAYDFIKTLSSYSVYQGNEGAVGSRYTATSTPQITETTHYSICITATPKTDNGYAVCGPKNETAQLFYSVATITVLNATVFGDETGWAYDLTANKTLSHDGTNYLFEQSMSQSLTRQYDLTYAVSHSGTNNTSSSSWTIQKTGYYLLQAWGAKGGKGGDATAATPKKTRSHTGGSGGAGAAVYSFVYLNEGDTVFFTVGRAGYNGSPGDSKPTSGDALATGTGGSGGYYAAISLQRNGAESTDIPYVLIAGGGGGGTGAGAAAGDRGTSAGSNGNVGNAASTEFNYAGTPTANSLDSFKGGSGNSGYADSGIFFNQGILTAYGGKSPGSGGASYCNTEIMNLGKTDDQTVYLGRLATALATSGDFAKPTSSNNSAARISYLCDDTTTEELEQFPGVEASGRFSRYFDIVKDENGTPLVDMVIKGETHDEKVTVIGDDGSITNTYYKEGLLIAEFTFVIIENENQTTSYEIHSTMYHPTFRAAKGVENTYIADCGFSIVIALQPKEGFLGGNDVPVLDDVGGEYSNVMVKKGEVEGYLISEPKADYANVAVDYDVASHFFIKEGYVVANDGDVSNDSVNTNDLYTLNIDLSSYEPWQKEFVEISYPEEQIITPSNYNQPFSLTAGLVPKNKDPKAAVIGDKDGALVTLESIVYIQYPIDYQLNHVQHDGTLYVTRDKVLSIKLQAEQGFLPLKIEQISVKRNGSNVSFTYDENTGILTVDSYYCTNNFTISASATPLPYTLHYVFSFDGVETHEVKEEYQAGAPINPEFLNNFLETYHVPEKEGHTFAWEWETDDGQPLTHMLGNDVWVLGGYKKDVHTLTIYYVNSSGAEIAETYVSEFEFGQSYAITSPKIQGYMPSSALLGDTTVDPFVISGEMGTENLVCTITYLQADNQLVILYLYPDGSEISRVERQLNEGEPFSATSPQVAGYHPDRATINGEIWNDASFVQGTMPAGDSILVQVHYKADSYRVALEFRYDSVDYPIAPPAGSSLTYDFSEAVIDGGEEIYIEYGNIYGYNPQTDEYGLPTPVAFGYEFAGWYTDLAFTDKVEEDRLVSMPAPEKLYAKWVAVQYKLVIRYVFVEGKYIAPDLSALPAGYLQKDSDNDGVVDYYYVEHGIYLGQNYSFILGTMEGYTPYFEYGIPDAKTQVEIIDGQMPALNLLYEVTYEINSYHLRFFSEGGNAHVEYPAYTSLAQETGPFEEDVLLAEGTYEHAEPVVYPNGSPNVVFEIYTFVPDYYTNAEGVPYPSELRATQNADLWSHYVAYENIAVLYNSSDEIVSYYYLLQDAIDDAEMLTLESGYTARVQLRRNEDVLGEDRNVLLNDTVIVGRGENVNYHVQLDLNGISICSDKTAFDIRDLRFILCNTNTETPASVIVESENDVVAILRSGEGNLYLGGASSGLQQGVDIVATSQTGDAIGVYETCTSGTLYHYSGVIKANALQGNAYGIWQNFANDPMQNTYHLNVYGTIEATARNDAYAILTNTSTDLYTASAKLTASSENGNAVALHGTKRIDFMSGTGGEITAYSVNGDAIGVRADYRLNPSSSSSTDPIVISATSENANAYAMQINEMNGSLSMRMKISAIAPNGNALAVRYGSSTAIVMINNYTTLYAEGKQAVALESNYETRIYTAVQAVGTERAVAIDAMGKKISICEGANIAAHSSAGNAYAVANAQIDYYNSITTASILATTDSGLAAALCNSSLNSFHSNISISASAESGTAIAFLMEYGASGGVKESVGAMLSATSESGTAYGAYIEGSATLLGATFTISGQEAYGVATYGSFGKITSIGGTFNVTATGNAYGVATFGGYVISPKAGWVVNVLSTGGNSYGLYSEGNSTIGSNTTISLAISTGVITAQADVGVGYALYAETGNIYICGDALYYKGTSDETRSFGDGVIILNGYVEQRKADDDASYPGYYYLTVLGKYYMVFVEYDENGNRIGEVATVEYKLNTGFVGSIPSAPNNAGAGYTGAWETYDFSAPKDMPETPEINGQYYKEVKLIYTRNSFTVYYYFNDSTNYSTTATVRYLDEIILPEMGERTLKGYVFNDRWERSDGISDWIMPAYSVSVYARWDKGRYQITFYTGGHDLSFTSGNITEIYKDSEKVIIEGEYNTYLDYTYVVPGYALGGFYTDSNYENKWSNYYIPAENITLWVYWMESVSFVMMGEFKEYSVWINALVDTNGDGVEEALSLGSLESVLGGNSNLFMAGELCAVDISPVWLMSALPEEMASQFGGNRLRVKGWYAPDGRPIKLAGGIGSWGITPDAEGKTQVYARLEPLANAGIITDLFAEAAYPIGTKMFGRWFNFLAAGVTNAAQDGGAGGYAYTLYKAITSGTHYLYMAENGKLGFYTQYLATVCKPDGREIVVFDGKIEHTMESLNFEKEEDFFVLQVPMEAGDMLVFRTYQLPNENGEREDGGTIFLISLPGIPEILYTLTDDPSSALSYYLLMHNATDLFIYSASMGDVQLPVYDPNDPMQSPAYKDVVGWIPLDKNQQLTNKVLTCISPALQNDPSLWIDMGGISMLYLMPQIPQDWTNAWIGAIAPDRQFSLEAFEENLPTEIQVRGATAVTFGFETQMVAAGEVAELVFANGLPAGTTLTLIDAGNGYPVYYYYIVSDNDVLTGALKNLPLASFIKCGGTQTFSGMSRRMLFHISYAGAESVPDSETIRISVSTKISDVALTFNRTQVDEQDLGERVVEVGGYIEETLTVNALTGKGYGEDDVAVLVVRLYDASGNIVPMPAGFLVEPESGFIDTYGDFAYAQLGKVKYFSSSTSFKGRLHTSALQYQNFKGKIVYEIVIVPAGIDLSGASFLGVQSSVDTRIFANLTIKDTPRVVLSQNQATLKRGETIALHVGVEGEQDGTRLITAYVLRRNGGEMAFTEDCATLLEIQGQSVPVGEDGEILFAMATGTGEFTISEHAELGVYYVVVYHQDAYAVFVLTVVE